MIYTYISSRFVIRQFVPTELDLFCDFFDDEKVVRHLPAYSREDYRILFKETFEDYSNGPLGRWGIFEPGNGAYIGNCLLRIFKEDKNALEIGYSIGKEYWGKGIGSELVVAMVNYAFSHTDSNDLIALTTKDNIGSQKVLNKAGFVRNGNMIRSGIDLFLLKKVNT